MMGAGEEGVGKNEEVKKSLKRAKWEQVWRGLGAGAGGKGAKGETEGRGRKGGGFCKRGMDGKGVNRGREGGWGACWSSNE